MSGHDLAKALRAAYLGLHRQTEARFARWGVTANQFVVLDALSAEDALTQRDLVARTSSDPSTLRAMLVLLEQRGYIRRREHPSDKRARNVSLTPEGRRVYEAMWAASEKLRKQLIDALGSDDTRCLVAALRKMATAMDADSGPTSPQSDEA